MIINVCMYVKHMNQVRTSDQEAGDKWMNSLKCSIAISDVFIELILLAI